MADGAKRGKRWADESEDEVSEPEEVKSPPSASAPSTQKNVYLSNLPYTVTETELLSLLPLAEEEKGQVQLKFLQREGRFSGAVEVSTSNPAIPTKLLELRQSEFKVGGRPIMINDSQVKQYSQGNRGPDRKHQGGKGPRNYDRKNSGQGQRGERYYEGKQEGEGHRQHEFKGEKRPYHNEQRKPRENFRKDSGEAKPVEEQARKPLRNENPEYKVKASDQAQAAKVDPKLPKSNPFGAAKPVSTREKDIEFDKKQVDVPVPTEEVPVEVQAQKPPPKPKTYRPRQQQQGQETKEQTEQKPTLEQRSSTTSQESKEESKQIIRRQAWGNPDETREIFQINHKKGPPKEAPRVEETEKHEEKQEETPTEQQPQQHHHNKFRNYQRGNRRGGMRRGNRPIKQQQQA
mmetsp:Transcript_21793/g.39738  ORF Transcript_21793/g.39738 Transcript_21793/m.39738 type:complete len:404 (-) Transcript_21793:2095-3306(-)